jgi:hypothetical protein
MNAATEVFWFLFLIEASCVTLLVGARAASGVVPVHLRSSSSLLLMYIVRQAFKTKLAVLVAECLLDLGRNFTKVTPGRGKQIQIFKI